MECKVEGHMSGMVAKSPARQACRRILLENNIWEREDLEFSLHYINFGLAVDAYMDISSTVELNCAEVMEGTGVGRRSDE